MTHQALSGITTPSGVPLVDLGHELKNAVTWVRADLQTALAALEDLEAGNQDVALARECLIASLAGIERIEFLALNLHAEPVPRAGSEPVDFGRLVDGVLREAAAELAVRARVQQDYAPVPPVDADPAALQQIVINLLRNAADAIAPGRPAENEVALSLWAEGGFVCLEVRDTGCGIEPHMVDRIFERNVTTKASRGGTGLGLAICRDLAARHGGEIRVRSALGSGTAFTVRFPTATNERAPFKLCTSAP